MTLYIEWIMIFISLLILLFPLALTHCGVSNSPSHSLYTTPPSPLFQVWRAKHELCIGVIALLRRQVGLTPACTVRTQDSERAVSAPPSSLLSPLQVPRVASESPPSPL